MNVDAEEGGGGRGAMRPPCGAPRAVGPRARGAGPARRQNFPPSRVASPRLTFKSVVPGYEAALDSHEAVERRYPGDALVEAATNLAFEPPSAPCSPWVWDFHRNCDPVVSPCERPF